MHQSIIKKYCLLSMTFPPLIVFFPAQFWQDAAIRGTLVLELPENRLNATIS